MKTVKLTDLHGKRVVDRDGVDIVAPKRPELPRPPEKSQADALVAGLDKLGRQLAEAADAQADRTNAQLLAIVETQQKIAEQLAKEPPAPANRWTIKVRREAGQIVDMTATQEYRK